MAELITDPHKWDWTRGPAAAISPPIYNDKPADQMFISISRKMPLASGGEEVFVNNAYWVQSHHDRLYDAEFVYVRKDEHYEIFVVRTGEKIITASAHSLDMAEAMKSLAEADRLANPQLPPVQFAHCPYCAVQMRVTEMDRNCTVCKRLLRIL